MNKFTNFTLISLALGLIACSNERDSLIDKGAIRLNKDQVTTFISDTTKKWPTNKGAAYRGADGTYLYKTGSKNGKGKWFVTDNGILCLQVSKWWGDKANCNWETYQLKGNFYSYDIKKNIKMLIKKEDISKGNNL